MNDYRNFQRKTRRKKGSNFNKHCKGKQALKQKNNYHVIFSNKYKQIDQSQHARHVRQRCDKFVKRQKKTKDIDDNLFHDSITTPDNNDKSHEQMLQELKCQVHQKIIEMHMWGKEFPYDSDHDEDTVKCIGPATFSLRSGYSCRDSLSGPRTPTRTVRLYCVDSTLYFLNMDNSVNNVKEKSEINANKKENNDDNDNILTRMACDVFLYCICDKYLYPNEIFLLLSVSKSIYTILTNNNYNGCSFLHSLISNQRLIDYLIKLIDSLNHIANNGPQLCSISEICDDNCKDDEDEDNDGIAVFSVEEIAWLDWERKHKIGPVKQFRRRIQNMYSICVSIISWLGDKSSEKLLLEHRDKQNVNPNVDTSLFVSSNCDVTDEELEKMYHLNKSLKKISQRLQYLFILAVSRLRLIGDGSDHDMNNNNNNSSNNNDKNVQVFCDIQVVNAFRETIATAKVINHLNKRYTNIKSRMILKSKVEFIHMSDYLRLYFDDKNIMRVDESHQNNCHTSIVENDEILCIYTWSKYKKLLEKSCLDPYRFIILHDDYDDSCSKHRLFKWISSLTGSNMSNALFFVVCVKNNL